jgi:hypothetical protein
MLHSKFKLCHNHSNRWVIVSLWIQTLSNKWVQMVKKLVKGFLQRMNLKHKCSCIINSAECDVSCASVLTKELQEWINILFRIVKCENNQSLQLLHLKSETNKKCKLIVKQISALFLYMFSSSWCSQCYEFYCWINYCCFLLTTQSAVFSKFPTLFTKVHKLFNPRSN